MIRIIGPNEMGYNDNESIVNTTSHSKNWSKGLSPFFLGPVECYGGLTAKNVENAWQYAKTYAAHIDANGDPIQSYFDWRDYGWAKERADRYPAGRGVRPIYTWWDGQKLTYIEARRKVYIRIYAKAVVKTYAFQKLKQLAAEQKELLLWDFDGYDHKALKQTYKDVFNNPQRKAGHGFVLGMLLDGVLDEDFRYVNEKDVVEIDR